MSFITEFNAGVRAIAKETLSLGLDKMVTQGVRDTGKLFKSAKYKIKYDDNEAELIQMQMHRYGFIQMSEGGLGSERVKSSPKMRGRQMRGGKPRKFMLEAVDEKVGEIADFVAEKMADRAVDQAKIGVVVRK